MPLTSATNYFMFLRIVADSFGRRPRHKLLTGAALALGMGVATAALSVSLDVGDRLAKEFRSLGANLIVTQLKTIFWHNNIVGFAPILEVPIKTAILPKPISSGFVPSLSATLIGTWSQHSIWTPDLQTRFVTGIEKTNPWWTVEGRWFSEDAAECVVGASFARKTGRQIGDAILVGDSDNRQILGVVGILSTGGPEDDAIVAPIAIAQNISAKPGAYRRLYVSALTKPEDAFAKRDPKTFTPKEYDTWFCTPYISSIAFQIQQELPGTDVRVIRRVAEGEGAILTRVRVLLWLVTGAALLAAALAVGASSAASVIERRTEIGLMKALGAGSGTVGFLLAAEQLLLAFVGGGAGYALGIILARLVGEKIFGVAPEPSLIVFFVIIALAAGVTILGSAFPLHRASRYEPAPILRGE